MPRGQAFALLGAALPLALSAACLPRHQLDEHADGSRLKGIACLAVLPFASSGDGGQAGIGFSEVMAADLMRTGRFGVLDPDEGNRLLAAHGGAASATADALAGQEIGKRLGVQAVMVGEVHRYDYQPSQRKDRPARPQVDLSAHLVDVQTGRDLWSATFAGNALPFFAEAKPALSDAAQAAVSQMVDSLSKEAGSETQAPASPCWSPATPTPAPTPTPVVEAPTATPTVVAIVIATPVPTPTPELRYIVVDKTKKEIELKQTIHFETDSAAFRNVPKGILEEVAKVMQDNPAMTIRIEGHTDSTGSPTHNLALSQMRANTIRDWLEVNGNIAESRLQAVGLGHQNPISTNRTPAGRALNRRVEFHILTQ